MKEICRKLCVGYLILIIGLLPILVFIMYVTYTEKLVAPFILIGMLLAVIGLACLEEE